MGTELNNVASHRLGDLVSSREIENTAISEQAREHLRLSLTWSELYLGNGRASHCDILLRGAYGTAIEAVFLLSFGLVRPAILSLRSHYELNLHYLYYMDHPVEWLAVQSFRENHQLNRKSDNMNYLKKYYPSFERRFNSLLACKTRERGDCYKVLSGISHGDAINSISTATTPADLIEEASVVKSASGVFLDVSELISDIYLSCFPSNWISVPSLIRTSVAGRMPKKSPPDMLQM